MNGLLVERTRESRGRAAPGRAVAYPVPPVSRHRLPLLPPLLLASLAACAAHRGTPFADTDYPGTLQDAATLPQDVLWQQRVTASWGGAHAGERGFDAAVQKQGDTLTVLGLSPIGSAGFAMILRGTTIELKNDTEQELPFPARFILLDVQRTFYPWLGAAMTTDGVRDGTTGEERVQETWASGRLVERRFTRISGTPAGAITVTYDWRGIDEPTRMAPPRTVLDNSWFDYRLVVETHSETRIAMPR